MKIELENIEQRVVELETRVAFQDDTILALNDTVARQQFELDKLQRHLKELTEQLLRSQSQIRDLQQEVPPPHY